MDSKFNSSFNGYNIKEVNKFVDEMASEYSKMLEKLKAKDEEIKDLKKKLDEKSINDYQPKDIIINSAKEEAEKIIINAKDNASRIVNEALLEAEKAELKAEKLRMNTITFKKKIRLIVNSQLDIIDELDNIKFDE